MPFCIQAYGERVSGPGYGDLSVEIKKDLKRAVGICFVAQVNETPEAGPAGTLSGNSNVTVLQLEKNGGLS